MAEATAFWVTGPGQGELRREALPPPGPGEVLVETAASGISRGTESLVFRGLVPESQHEAMRAPHQAGSFAFPVKYGYSSAGVVAAGEAAWVGARVFCLHPHQDRYVVPASAVRRIPKGVPDTRAVLAANLETAINGLWDAAPRIGDRIAVVGAGVIGMLTAALVARIPGATVQLVDVDLGKMRIAEALGLRLVAPDDAERDADVVVHTSGTAEGLGTALRLAGFEATVLELSWYGATPVTAPLGEAFHSRRLVLRSSQVGHVASERRARWDHGSRLGLALRLLEDARFDALLEPAVPFARLPEVMARVLGPGSGALCQVVSYQEWGEACSL
jgi:2-desacetyl-2-hydroxyethyl bacteriochlorophyllide A dehydrogenase